ncbi:MAG: hypothetical protein A2270_00605 [Elusimicrobia bacterium RIFOXYA12_FULL_51_18]|nr:MAG: hypothetical protein A2270_00605 [Elusimicrobia bacterium RIFOXYA12_FULL_51_18]OGS28998.1 MAG: hypothetical protein A2218_08620 [Elusimicrobia bacterium RIFOXYA2_FULL_53_38]
MTFYIVGGLAVILILFLIQRRKLMLTAIQAIKQAFLSQSDMILLQRVGKPQWKRAELVDKLTQELLAEGFSDAGSFAIDRMPGALVRMMTGPGGDATAAVCDHPGIGAWVDITTIYEDGRIVTATSAPKTGLPSPDWSRTLRFPGEPVAKLYSELLVSRPKDGIRPISADEASSEFERAYFKHTVWVKQRDISLADLQKMIDERIKDGSEQTPYMTAKHAQKRHDRRERWIAAIGLAIAAIMLISAYFILALGWQEHCLSTRGKVISAAVTDLRVRKIRSRREVCEVRYKFQVENGEQYYTNRALWRGENPWASLRRSVCDDVRKSGFVAVKYDPKDPWTHELVETSGISGVTDKPWIFVLSSLPFILAGIFAFVLGFSALMLVLIG